MATTGKPLAKLRNWLAGKLAPEWRARADVSQAAATIAASYDSAQTNRHNQKHWAAADALSPNASQTQGIRRVMRNRSRYEAGSNPLYQGIIRTVADHTIGSGPRVQWLGPDPHLNARLDELWTEWTAAIGLDQKLWTMKETQVRDGECFLLTIGNPALKSRIQLDYQLLEGDYVTSLRPQWTPWQVDGITYDPQWNPVSYQIVTQRPNDVLPIVWPQQHKVDAKFVIHYYRQERPGQGRGVPELQAAFELLAVLRRYILATCSAAEVAASFAAFIKSNGPPIADTTGASTSADAWLTLEIQRNLVTMLPDGYSIEQLDPKQPTQSFKEFCEMVITLLCRCISMPLNIATCSSQGYSYSSSRMDHQTWFSAIDIDRCNRINHKVLIRILNDFLAEARLVLEFSREAIARVRTEIHWPPPISVDPVKETDAASSAVEAGLISITDAQKKANTGGNVIRENAEYFGVSEDEVRKAMFDKIFKGDKQPDQAPDQPQTEENRDDAPRRPGPPRPGKAATASAARSTTISAAAPRADSLEISGATSSANLKLIASDPKAEPNAVPKFRMVAYNGGAMRLDGHEYPVVIDLATCVCASPKTPILYEHDPERELGHTDQVVIDAGGITVPQGFFSGASPERDKVVTAAQRKYPWQASVGGRAEHIDIIPEGEEVTLNGQTFAGPVEAAYGVRLREISILSLGADSTTSAELAAAAGKRLRAAQSPGDAAVGYEEWVRSMGFDVSTLSEQQKQSLMNEWQSKQAATQAHVDENDESAEREEEDDQDNNPRTEAGDDDEENPRTEANEEEEEEDDEETDPPRKTKAAAAKSATSLRAQRKKEKKVAIHARNQRLAVQARQFVRKNAAQEIRRVHAIQAACGKNVELAAKAIEMNWSAEKVELEVLRASRPAGVYAGPLTSGRESGAPEYSAVVECSMLMASGVAEDKLEKIDKRRYTPDIINAACERDNRSYTLTRLTQEYLMARGHHVSPGRLGDETIRAALRMSQNDIQAADGAGGFSTASLSGILSNLLNKSLLVSFLAVPTASEDFCGGQDLNDFKVATRYRLSMAGTIQKVGATGELKSTTFNDESWTNQLDTYGTLITLNRQMLINDDLDALLQLPRLLGRQSALAVEEAVFTLLLANANQPDGNAFFSAPHNNYLAAGSGNALSIPALTNALVLFLKQTDAQGKPIVLSPAALLVSPENKILADQLFKDTNIITLLGTSTAAGKVVPQSNPHGGKYRPVQSPYLSNGILANNSATGWYLLADPADVPMISVGYLRGQRTPTIDQGQTDMDILGFRWRCFFDFGVGAVDWRAGVFAVGT